MEKTEKVKMNSESSRKELHNNRAAAFARLAGILPDQGMDEKKLKEERLSRQ